MLIKQTLFKGGNFKSIQQAGMAKLTPIGFS